MESNERTALFEQLKAARSAYEEVIAKAVEVGEKGAAFASQKEVTKALHIALANTRDEDKPDKLSRGFGLTAVKWQQDNACHPMESIRKAAEVHDRSFQEIVDHSLHTENFYHLNWVVNCTVSFWTSEKRGSTFRGAMKTLKSSVKGSGSLFNAVDQIFNFQELKRKVDVLEEGLKESNKRVNETEMNAALMKMDIEVIKAATNSLSAPVKEQALMLLRMGQTQVAVASHLNISERNLRRWVKEAESKVV